MRPKSESSNFGHWFLVRVSPIFENTERMKKLVQSTLTGSTPGKGDSISAKKDLLLHNTTFLIAHWKTVLYANMLEEYDTWWQVFNQIFEVRATNVYLLV